MFGWFKKKSHYTKAPASAPVERSLVEDMHQMLTMHGIDARIENDWTLVNNDFPLLGATRYLKNVSETSATVQIDFVLCLRDGRSIVEIYAGWGDDVRQAEAQALYKFCIGAMHVFLSAFWDHHEPDQVDIEHWSINGGAWDAYLSSIIKQSNLDQKIRTPSNYMNDLQQAVSLMSLADCDHWISVYIGVVKDDITVDVRLDNEESADLINVVRALDWPITEGFYSERQFVLLRPASK